MAFPTAKTHFDEIFEFLASGPTTEEIIAFQPSESLQERLSLLLERNRSDQITLEERAEVEEFIRIDRFVSRIKLHARKAAGKL